MDCKPGTSARSTGVMAFIVCLLLFACSFIADANAAPVAVPPLSARVVDQTGTLDDAQVQALESQLEDIERSKGAQVAVLVVATTGDETIEQYSIRVVDVWKLGRKGVDDGALVLASMDDHKLRIEVGRGLEGTIPDAIANRIVDGFVEPKFKLHDYAGGLRAAVERLAGLIDGQPLPSPPPELASASTDAASDAADAPSTLVPVPPRSGRVVDAANFLFAKDRAELEAKLAAIESSRSRHVGVLLVANTGEEIAAQFAQRALETWQKDGGGDKDDALVLMRTDQEGDSIAVAVAGVLRGRITDDDVQRIHFEDMSPDFIRGDYAGGLAKGADLVASVVNGEALPPPPKPEGSFASSLLDAIMPPPFEMAPWLGMIVGLPFVFIFASGLLSWKSALLRASVTSVSVCVFLLLIGSGWLFAVLLGAIAIYPAVLFQSDGPEPDWKPDPRSSSNVSFGSIAWSLLGMAASSAISSGGGGHGGFSGGGGGFSGGGASGSW